MPDPIIPDPVLPNPPGAVEQRERGRTLVCECCGSKLDRHGNLLRRGELAKQMIDTEDKLDTLRKQLAKASDDNNTLRQEIDSLKAQMPAKKQSLWNREA